MYSYSEIRSIESALRTPTAVTANQNRAISASREIQYLSREKNMFLKINLLKELVKIEAAGFTYSCVFAAEVKVASSSWTDFLKISVWRTHTLTIVQYEARRYRFTNKDQ